MNKVARIQTGTGTTLVAIALLFGANPIKAQQVINNSLVVKGSECVGLDCPNSPSFGFDTILLRENNLRIKFDDTSSTSSFPSNDWQITANDSSNGGANKFSIDDITGGRTPFTLEASAPSHSLYVDDGGRIGFGTSTPVVELHVKDGDTPTLRLEQDGSSGFTPQTWDVAGNETNFFVRDATNGSTLPLRIRPGAPSNSIFIKESSGDIGMGTSSPSDALHVQRTGPARLRLTNGSITNNAINNKDWIINSNGTLRISDAGDVISEFELDASGNLTVSGSYKVNGTTLNVPDYVFEPGYRLRPLEEVKYFIEENRHLPEIPSTADVSQQGLDMTDMQLRLLQKVEELTLYTLQQHETIQQLERKVQVLETRNP